jgi:hypothetical protein
MANKQQQPYSAIMKHLPLRIGITLVKAAHHCLRGSRKRHQQQQGYIRGIKVQNHAGFAMRNGHGQISDQKWDGVRKGDELTQDELLVSAYSTM